MTCDFSQIMKVSPEIILYSSAKLLIRKVPTTELQCLFRRSKAFFSKCTTDFHEGIWHIVVAH